MWAANNNGRGKVIKTCFHAGVQHLLLYFNQICAAHRVKNDFEFRPALGRFESILPIFATELMPPN